MKVSEVMTKDIETLRPDQQARDAARFMLQADAGSIPVTDGERLVGMITDRDIAVRAVAEGLGPETKISQVISREVRYCFEDDDLDDVAANMGKIQVRRLPVLNRDKRLVGIVALSDVASCEDPKKTGKAVAGISTPGGLHSQTTH